ncbi:peptidyl-prolyl cis-trans isomerase FKBP2-like [Ruditapes philippinarum]|uniref:peptidyl-prolyl cis-trans isomerase FKBP2-like n=1 Tax=Ruditapes philippinarum TaxID=129788 RepID=UPI00295B7E7B|nr:peptidyl-prolyl cis-trans isomerase FKBP2-like [Ruditapes philippinarum]
MKYTMICISLVLAAVIWTSHCDDDDDKKPKKLQIGIQKRAESCPMKSRKGDTLHMQYKGTLHETGEEFDSSYSRNQPFIFTLGTGQVIKGWDQGLLGMCEGEKRKLVVPADMGYGARGAPPKIPANAALVFEVVLDKIVRHGDL